MATRLIPSTEHRARHWLAPPDPGHLLAVPWRGDAWVPAVRAGDAVLVDPARLPAAGDFVCARAPGGYLLGDLMRQAGGWWLVGPAGEELPLGGVVELVGPVVGVRRGYTHAGQGRRERSHRRQPRPGGAGTQEGARPS